MVLVKEEKDSEDSTFNLIIIMIIINVFSKARRKSASDKPNLDVNA